MFLTGPVNLTSNMELYLERGAVVRAAPEDPPLLPALPAYGPPGNFDITRWGRVKADLRDAVPRHHPLVAESGRRPSGAAS